MCLRVHLKIYSAVLTSDIVKTALDKASSKDDAENDSSATNKPRLSYVKDVSIYL